MKEIRITVPGKIVSNATTYTGRESSNTWWSATVYANGIEIACVGINGEGRHSTAQSAENAALKLARARLS